MLRRNLKWLPPAVGLALLLKFHLPVQSQTEPLPQVEVADVNPRIPLDESFPDGISPSHVYSKLERLNRTLDTIIKARNVPIPTFPERIETGLMPMHVYQAVLSCTDQLQEFDDQLDVFAIPTITVRPTTYAPRDVFFVVVTMLDNVHRIGRDLRIDNLPSDEIVVADKTPTDVFGLSVQVFIKLNALCGHTDLRPAEVYAQMVRGVEDVKSILRQNDPACRYRINAPPSPDDRTPADVFQKCLAIRRLVNRHRERLGMPTIPVPEPPGNVVRPRDVFFQTQVIIAELNLLKMRLNTISSTPLPIPVADETTPTDVHAQATMIEFLLDQVGEAGTRPLSSEAPEPEGTN